MELWRAWGEGAGGSIRRLLQKSRGETIVDRPRDRTHISCFLTQSLNAHLLLGRRIIYCWAMREAQRSIRWWYKCSPWTNITDPTWELVWNAKTSVPPRPAGWRSVFSQGSRGSSTQSSLRSLKVSHTFCPDCPKIIHWWNVFVPQNAPGCHHILSDSVRKAEPCVHEDKQQAVRGVPWSSSKMPGRWGRKVRKFYLTFSLARKL